MKREEKEENSGSPESGCKLYKKGRARSWRARRRLKENPWLNGVGNVTCNYHYGVAV
jgi:hypothetical protein